MKRLSYLALLLIMLTFYVNPALSQIAVGDSVLNFNLPDKNGNTVKLIDFSGEILVLNFFASWCIPCQTEAPLLQDSIWENYSGRGVTVIGLAQEPLTNFESFIDDHGLTYPIAIDTASVFFKEYGFQIIPSNILVNRDGKIAFIENGFDIPLFMDLIDSLLSITSIEDHFGNSVVFPHNLSLVKNYPNPFNSQTKVEFNLTRAQDVKLEIYSIDGKKVYENEISFPAGRNLFQINLNNHASGVYVYALRAGTDRVAGKFVLNK